MATGITNPNVGDQDKTGDYLRKLDNGQNGGRQGPILVLASMTVPAYGANTPVAAVGDVSPGTDDVDCFLACDATGGAIVITAPVAVSTPLGSTIAVTKLDATGSTVTFSATDATISNGATTKTVARGVVTRFTLMNNAGTLTWVAD